MYMVNETLLSLTYQWVLQYASAASGTAALCAARTVQYDIRPLLYGHVEKLLFCACGPLGSQLTGSDVRGRMSSFRLRKSVYRSSCGTFTRPVYSSRAQLPKLHHNFTLGISPLSPSLSSSEPLVTPPQSLSLPSPGHILRRTVSPALPQALSYME